MNQMTDLNSHRLNYFDYIDLAKKEFQIMSEKHPELASLSKRELEIFSHLLSDKTQGEIAQELFISPSSVHFHCKNIYRKLNVSSRKQILILYKDL